MTDVDLAAKLLVALLLGAAVGFERETANLSAGIRTHALVALGAALFTVAGAYGFSDITTSANVDPARVAAQIASGIGFIGAGAIIRDGASVRGVTTAATLWLSGALGVGVGAGLFGPSIAAALLAIAALVSLRALKTRARRFGYDEWRMSLAYNRGFGTLGEVLRRLQDAHHEVTGIDIQDDISDVRRPGIRNVELIVRTKDNDALLTIAEQFNQLSEFIHVRLVNSNS